MLKPGASARSNRSRIESARAEACSTSKDCLAETGPELAASTSTKNKRVDMDMRNLLDARERPEKVGDRRTAIKQALR